MSVRRSLSFCLLVLFAVTHVPSLYSAEQKKQEPAKKIATQNIGGLLFDVDEGVKVEQGPGGSVYMKSNKEYMQEKLSQIDQRFSELEARVARLEEKNKLVAQAAGPGAPAPAPVEEKDGRRVLIT